MTRPRPEPGGIFEDETGFEDDGSVSLDELAAELDLDPDELEAEPGECPVPGCDKPARHSGAHRAGGRKRADGGARVVPITTAGDKTHTAQQRLLDEAGRILDELQADAISALAPWAPYVSGTLATRMEQNTRAVLVICRTRPKVLEKILAGAELNAAVTLVTTVAGLGIATGAEFGMVDPYGRMGRGFDLDQIADALEAERDRTHRDVASAFGAATGPQPEPGMSPVGGLMAEIG